MDTASGLSRQWLTSVGVPASAQASIVADVEERLLALPSLLRSGSRVADRMLGVLPVSMLAAAVKLPGASEWARMVISLTAVAYFERAGSTPELPTQRTPSVRVDLGT